MEPRCVVLLSGGLDSTTVLAMARAEGFACHALSFSYGQRHAVELAAAARVARILGAADHRVAHIDLGWIGGSALTAGLPVPKDALFEGSGSIPVTYVPARNALFLCHALGWAEVLGAQDIFAGMNVLDYSGYPDCRPEFVSAFAEMARLGTRAGVQGRPFHIRTPLMYLNKAEIIRAGRLLGVDYGLTHSCYDPVAGPEAGLDGGPHVGPDASPQTGPDAGSPPSQALSCGHCDACLLRQRGFAQAGVPDPTRYA